MDALRNTLFVIVANKQGCESPTHPCSSLTNKRTTNRNHQPFRPRQSPRPDPLLLLRSPYLPAGLARRPTDMEPGVVEPAEVLRLLGLDKVVKSRSVGFITCNSRIRAGVLDLLAFIAGAVPMQT